MGCLQSISYGSTTEMNGTEMNASGPCYVKEDLSASGFPRYGNTINMPDAKELDTLITTEYGRNQEAQALDQPQLSPWGDNAGFLRSVGVNYPVTLKEGISSPSPSPISHLANFSPRTRRKIVRGI